MKPYIPIDKSRGLTALSVTSNDVVLIRELIERIRQSQRGKDLLKILEDPKMEYIISKDNDRNPRWDGTNVVYFDPNFRDDYIYVKGKKDPVRASPFRILAHELGHLATKEGDDDVPSLPKGNQYVQYHR